MQNDSFLMAYRQTDFLKRQTQLLLQSYQHWTRVPLIPPSADSVKDLINFAYPIASHIAGKDPQFNYANQAALALFKMRDDEFLGLPSRYSAEPMVREQRAAFLAEVTANGFVENYSGVRIAKDGSRFLIEQATVWNVVDIALPKDILGQAVVIKKWTPL
jgi:PAS domain-containing protein